MAKFAKHCIKKNYLYAIIAKLFVNPGLDHQRNFFTQLKDRVRPGLPFVDEVADALEISTDSAYRRIRYPSALTLNESIRLSKHFELSIDGNIGLSSDSTSFRKILLRNYGTTCLSSLKNRCSSAEPEKKSATIFLESPFTGSKH